MDGAEHGRVGRIQAEAAGGSERGVEVLDRLRYREDARGALAGAQVGLESAPVVAGGVGVVGEQRGELVEPVGVERLGRGDRRRMKLPAAPAKQPAVGRLLDQRVAEGEERHRPAGTLTKELRGLELAERGADRATVAGDLLEDRQRELPAEDRRDPEEVLRRGGEAIDPGEDQLLDGLRKLHRHVALEDPASLGGAKRSGLDHRADELLQVEGVALGPSEEPSLELVGERGAAGERGEQLAVALPAERLERELARAVREVAQGVLAKRQGCVPALDPARQDEQDRRALRELEEAPEEGERGGVRPVEVVERQRQWPLAREPLEELDSRRVDPLLDHLRGRIRGAGAAGG